MCLAPPVAPLTAGKFPFEGDSVSTMAVTDPMKKIWLQQNKTSWNNNATLRDQLPFMSPEAKDLLDRIFELDEKKRIDVRSIKMHPWFQVRLWCCHVRIGALALCGFGGRLVLLNCFWRCC